MRKCFLAIAAIATSHACGPANKPDTMPAPAQPVGAAASAPDRPAPAAAAPAPKAIEAPALIATPLADDPTKTTIHRLSNGMTVYLSPDSQEPSIVAHLAVRAGSRNDPQQSTGLAHYLEHMLFKGTSKLGTLDYEKEKPHLARIAALYADLRKPGADRDKILHEIDSETQASAELAVPNELDQLYNRIGVTGLNAFTANDATVYISRIPKNRVAQWARIEAQRYADAVFRLFWPELEAVYEEKNRALDNPNRRWREAFLKAMFPRHGYGWSSGIGEIEHLKSPAYGDMEAFFQRYYTPGNMAILLSGDVDESVLPILEAEFGSFKRPAGDAPPPGEAPRLHGRTQIDVTVPANEGVILGWPLVSATHPDRLALEVMDLLLLDGTSGILQRDLLLPQKVASAASNPDFLREAGTFELRADALAGQSHEALEKLLLEEVGKLTRGEFTDRDLATAVLSADIQQQRMIESNAGRMQVMEGAFIDGEDWHNVVSRIERMRRLTRDDILRVAQRYLTSDFLVIRKVKGTAQPPKITKPSITAVKVDPTRRGAFAQSVLDMPVAPIEPVAIAAGRDYERAATAAGPLIAVKNQRNGLFTVHYDYDVGRVDDRFVCLALEMLKVSGAGKRSAEQVTRELHELGVSVDTNCSRNDSGITISGVDKNLDAAMALVREWLAEPVFDADTLKARVATVLTERANQLTTPQVIAAAQQAFARYGQDTEYLVVPSNKELEAVSAAQVKTALAGFLHWKRRTSYYGPRALAAASAAVVLGDGKRATAPRKALRFRKPNTALVTDQQTAQTHIWLTWPRAPASDAERAVGTVFREYIAPILFQEVREARGLAYTVTGGYGAGAKKADDGVVFAYVGTQSDKSHDALDALLATLRQGVDDKRFAVAKEALAEKHRVDRIAPRAIAGAVYRWQDEGETADPRAARQARVAKVDRAALERWLKAALSGPVIVSITGDHGKLDDARIGKLAPVTLVPVAKLFGY
ncbi:MAG TPA: insulinase family protein [Kofleriaceae bacterium]|nr:insulinase family protein [Kofleriaceae bacterium]